MIKSAVEASHIPTFHYMDEINVDALLAVRYELPVQHHSLAAGNGVE
jgi:hypothetical protein